MRPNDLVRRPRVLVSEDVDVEGLPPIIDAKVLMQLADPTHGGDPTFAAEIVGIFLDETPGRLDAMHAAVARGDAEALARTAHALTSSAGSLGLPRMRALCIDVEVSCRRGAFDVAVLLVPRLSAAFAQSGDALRAHIASLEGAAR